MIFSPCATLVQDLGVVLVGEVLSRRLIHDGRIVKLSTQRVLLPNGALTDLEVIEHPGASTILPFLDPGQVLLIRQHRHCTGGDILEVPAGTLQPGETPEDCARREIEEETGYRAGRLEPLGWIWTTPGFTTEKIFLFAAHDLEPGRLSTDADEVIVVERMSFRDALESAVKGEITDAKTIATLFRASARAGSR
jgi:ADP-ribose pyrophosphatase